LKSWEQALTIYREIKDRKGEGGVLGNLGIAYYTLGNYLKAINYHKKSLLIAREIQDRKGEDNALGNLGNTYHALGYYPEAIDFQEQSLAIARELEDPNSDSIGVRDRSIFTRTNSTPQNTTAKRDQFAIKVFPSSDDDPSKDLQKLHEILIDPIADLLPTDPNERVIFIPQNELFLVPFPALKDAQGKYLIEKHTILTAPSIQVLGLTHERAKEVKRASVQNALVVGNPDMPSVAPKIGEEAQPLSKLPGAEKEAEAITPLLKENNLKTKLLKDKQATKAAVLELLPQAKIIHLATHGLFDNIQGLQSAIALAPSGKDNGLLTAEEILNLKLNADLVVLSACNTGRGRITGDGVIAVRSLIFEGMRN
jgi:CHAT domain-containing protein